MADWRTWLQERKQRGKAEWDQLVGKSPMTDEERTRRELYYEGTKLFPSRTYREYQWEQRHERRKKHLVRYDARRQLYPNFFMFYWGYLLDWNYDGKIFSAAQTEKLNKLLPPHYLKHPTEDRMVTWPQWKHAQHAVIRDQEYLYHQMFCEHSLLFRALVWMSHPEEHISPIDRLIMKCRGQTREERLAQKAIDVDTIWEGLKFWKLPAEVAHSIVHRIKHVMRKGKGNND